MDARRERAGRVEGCVGPRSGLCSMERKNARPLVGAVDLGERLVVAAKAVEDRGAQGAGGEGRGVRRAAVGALLHERQNARPLVGAVDLGERLVVAAEAVGGWTARRWRVLRVRGVRRADVGAAAPWSRKNARPLVGAVDLGERLVVAAKAVEDRRRAASGSAEGTGVRRADVGALLLERKNARPLLGAVDLGERRVVAAEAFEDEGAQPAGGEGIAVRRADVGALLLERKNARPLLGAVDLGERRG